MNLSLFFFQSSEISIRLYLITPTVHKMRSLTLSLPLQKLTDNTVSSSLLSGATYSSSYNLLLIAILLTEESWPTASWTSGQSLFDRKLWEKSSLTDRCIFWKLDLCDVILSSFNFFLQFFLHKSVCLFHIHLFLSRSLFNTYSVQKCNIIDLTQHLDIFPRKFGSKPAVKIIRHPGCA